MSAGLDNPQQRVAAALLDVDNPYAALDAAVVIATLREDAVERVVEVLRDGDRRYNIIAEDIVAAILGPAPSPGIANKEEPNEH